MLTLHPGQVTLNELNEIYRHHKAARLSETANRAVKTASEWIDEAVAGDMAVYGINTGFGKLASVRIAKEDTATLQRNLILSHCAGVGDAMPKNITRLMMALKLISLGRGASGVRLALTQQIENLLAYEVTPVVPGQGSVGASGDLAPLAHMAAVLIGEGEAEFGGKIMNGGAALRAAGLKPIVLGPKEGLALINGTQFSCSYALAGLFEAWRAAKTSLLTSALSMDAAMASTAPLHPEIHSLRGHRGQMEAAGTMRTLLQGSVIRDSHRDDDPRVQDPYCMRCQPQVVGASIDLIRQAADTLRREANAATDNPLVLSDGSIVSGGNFHAEPVAFAADMIALAMAEIGAIAQRRVALLVDPALSFDLPPFLAEDPGLNSGMMVVEITSAALMSENKHLANPCSTDSTPTSANQEDHVSMAAHGARRLMKMADNLHQILGIEMFCAAEGVRFRAPIETSAALKKACQTFYVKVPPLTEDRFVAGDLKACADMIRSGELLKASETQFPGLENL